MINQYIESNEENLSKIDHVVVLMLENRSFDNLLGWLYNDKPPYDKPPHGQHFEGLTKDMWNPLNNIDADGVPFIEKVLVERNGQKKMRFGKEVPNPVDYTLPNPDPGEGYKDTNHQLFEMYNVPLQYPPPAVNTGFVNNYQSAMLYGTYSFGDGPTDPRAIMKCYTPEQTPVLSALARNFAVCDHYYCSVPSQTLPNRDFVHAATSSGHVNNGPDAHCDGKTIFNQIQDAIDKGRDDLSWKIFGNNMFDHKKRNVDGIFEGDHFSLTRLIMNKLHDPKFDENFGTLDEFKTLCTKGELPSYSFLEPVYHGPGQNDQHPPSDIRAGDELIADVFNMVKNSGVCEKTLLIITYDEHGGSYDHVPPPGGAKNPDKKKRPGQHGFLFNRFGVRVPCVVINPYIPQGLIARAKGYTPFDHTSIIKTIQKCFKLEGHLTERDKAAPDFSGMLSLPTPDKREDIKIEPLDRKIDENCYHVNDLIRLIGNVMEYMTGIPEADFDDKSEHIQLCYNKKFKKDTK